MKKVTIQFEKCIQNIQELKTEDECMFSSVFMSLYYPSGKMENISVNIKQTNGSDFVNDPLEVYSPSNLRVDSGQFRDEVEKYYRMCVGKNAFGIKLGTGNVSNIRMYNNTFKIPYKTEVNYVDNTND